MQKIRDKNHGPSLQLPLIVEKTIYLDLLEFLKNLREERHLQLPPPPTPVAQVSLNDAPVQELVVLLPSNKERRSPRRRTGGRSAKQI
jgi:hypothetical protein